MNLRNLYIKLRNLYIKVRSYIIQDIENLNRNCSKRRSFSTKYQIKRNILRSRQDGIEINHFMNRFISQINARIIERGISINQFIKEIICSRNFWNIHIHRLKNRGEFESELLSFSPSIYITPYLIKNVYTHAGSI